MAIGLVTATSDLPDAMAQSLFHRLRHQAKGLALQHSAPGVLGNEQLRELLGQWIAEAELKPQRRRGLQQRLAQAGQEELPVDVRYALQTFRGHANSQCMELRRRLESLAAHRGETREEVTARFVALRAEAPAGRHPRVDDHERRWLRGLSADPATRYVLHRLELDLPAEHDPEGTPLGEARCARCGQFSGQLHRCPAVDVTGVVWPREPDPPIPLIDVDVDDDGDPVYAGEGSRLRVCAGPQVIAQLAPDAGAPMVLPFGARIAASAFNDGYQGSGPGEVSGHIGVAIDPGTDAVVVVGRTLQCNACSLGRPCRHHIVAVDGVRRYLQESLSERAAAIGKVADGIAAQPAGSGGAPPLPADLSTFRYSDSPELFAQHMQVARDTAVDGQEDPVGFMTTEAVYGYGQDRAFGVELEYVQGWDPGEEPAHDLGRSLYNTGLTTAPYQAKYHAAQHSGYTTDEDGWSLEDDGTVDGELVSPILTDTPTSWENMASAIATLRRHGMRADSRTGGHVHVAAAEFAGSLDRITGLCRIANRYERLLDGFSNVGWGRSRQHNAGPIHSPPPIGYLTGAEALHHQGRGATVNLEAVVYPPDEYPSAAHLEWRCWDGSLEPGRIQAQVKLSLAITDYAARNPDPAGNLHPAPDTGPSADPAGRTSAADTAEVRAFIDMLFRRDADKEQIARLWGLSGRP